MLRGLVAMFAKLALLFIVVPIIEIALLVKVGQLIDFWPTVALVVGTGMLGAYLARLQGRRVLGAIRASLSRGELPAEALVDGLIVLVAGVLLVTPGVLTDLTGLALLIPPVRAVLRRRVRSRIQGQVMGEVSSRAGGLFDGGGGGGGGGRSSFFAQRSRFVNITPPGAGSPPGGRHGEDDVLEGELIDVTPERERSDLRH